MLSSYDLDEAAKKCVLADCFHLTHFKAFQTCVIDAVLNKRDSLVIQPTGSGKSLCYQFLAVYTKTGDTCNYANHKLDARSNK